MLLGGFLALRRGEMLALRWVDIDFERHRITVSRSLEQIQVPGAAEGEPGSRLSSKSPKDGKARTVALPAFVAEALRRHRAAQNKLRLLVGPGYDAEGDLVVADPSGKPWAPTSFSPGSSPRPRRSGSPVCTTTCSGTRLHQGGLRRGRQVPPRACRAPQRRVHDGPLRAHARRDAGRGGGQARRIGPQRGELSPVKKPTRGPFGGPCEQKVNISRRKIPGNPGVRRKPSWYKGKRIARL